MSQINLQTSIEYLKGVGPQRAELLQKELKVFTFGDLLRLYPYRYVDRTRFYKISELRAADTEVQLLGKVTNLSEVAGKGRSKRLTATFSDDTGSVELVWFKGIQWVRKSIKPNQSYVLYGKPSIYGGRFNFAHPELELLEDFKQSPVSGLQPLYPSTEKLNQRGLNNKAIGKLTRHLIPLLKGQVQDHFSTEQREKLALPALEASYFEVHFPRNLERLEQARYRLKFDEFFFLQLAILRQKDAHRQQYKGFVFSEVGNSFKRFYDEVLPFELTGAQKRVLREIRQDMRHGAHMNRLVQGDVGSGKTIVALMCMLLAIDNGFQACLMAPTEILATQHFNSLQELLQPLGLEVELLTGSVKAAPRREIHRKLQDGSLKILVGTHALIEPTVKFKNLGLAVVDEQHRFGVAQRARLWQKNKLPPHVLVMTATPIPRTLAMSVYGNLDISVIDELPPGRKPITTLHRYDSNRLAVFGFLKDEITKGRQIYIVYPLIEESEKLDLKDLMDGYESIARAFPKPQYQISIVHGRMSAEDKEYEMQRFARGETQLMVATTVIEVGVNVPNASVMVIENANRFGLSQLHQLRGRVGRGAEKSYCILMTGHKLSSDAKTRIETMVRTNDGFEISEVDMKLRGPGDLMGTRQSGILNLQIADLLKDGLILERAREVASMLLQSDPSLEKPQNQGIRYRFERKQKGQVEWGRIS